MKWKWIDADCTSVTTAEGTLTLKGLFIPLFIEQLLMNMTGTVNTLMLGHMRMMRSRQSVRQTR